MAPLLSMAQRHARGTLLPRIRWPPADRPAISFAPHCPQLAHPTIAPLRPRPQFETYYTRLQVSADLAMMPPYLVCPKLIA